MAQITSGIRSVLSAPKVYNLFQNLIGAKRGREIFTQEILSVSENAKVLDIGCGTAEILHYLPRSIEYYGYDVSTDYISSAQERYVRRKATFVAGLLTREEVRCLPAFDLVLASGLLHHLDDHDAVELFQMARSALSSDGEFISIDPCYIANQNKVARFIVSKDRGQNVRSIDALYSLAKRVFDNIEAEHRTDLLAIPYDHVVLRGRK